MELVFNQLADANIPLGIVTTTRCFLESDMKVGDVHYPNDVNGSRTSVRVEKANV